MYDLAIIGGGPAGYTAAEQASLNGLKTILFEKEQLGGTCLNVGCIPTKTLLYSAKQYHNALNARKYGVEAQAVSFDYQKMQQRKQKVVRKLVAGIKQRLKNDNMTMVSGRAVVVSHDEKTIVIECGGEKYEAQRLLIATGSNNFVPPIPGINGNADVWSSTEALSATELPASIVIVGGGVIGMEFATLYHELGVKVTVVEAMPSVLPQLDPECVSLLLDKYKKSGIDILTSTKVLAIDGKKVICELQGGERLTIETDKILISVGRRANLDGLDNLKVDMERGAIVVNDMMQTSCKNIFAAGDVTGKIMLAHVASRQAEVAVGYMLKQIPLQRIAYNAIPSVVYTNPEIASVGLQERDLKGENCVLPIEYELKSLPMTFSGRFVAENEGETGLCKMVVDKKNKTILGVHMIGNPCSEFVAAASFAVRMGYTVAEFRQVVFPHPTVSEILKETANIE